jgi:RNA polymerase sigma-B factor
VTMHAELRALPDDVLLARLRPLPRGCAERDAICEILVGRYRPLVTGCVRQYRNSPEPAEDLMQVGYVGLLKAINNFDPAYGGSLMAYARPCVSGEIKRHFRDKRWQMRVPRQSQELLLEMRAAEEDLTRRLSRAPDDSELAATLGVPEADVLEARRAHLAFSAYSLDAPLPGEQDPALLGDMLGEDDQALAHATDIESVTAHLDELPQREQRILMLKFYGNLTQEQIAERLGISQMHVSRLLNRALAYLRHQLTTDPPTTAPHPARPEPALPAKVRAQYLALFAAVAWPRKAKVGPTNSPAPLSAMFSTASLSGCRRSGLDSGFTDVSWAYARGARFNYLVASCAYTRAPRRSRANVGPSLGPGAQLRGPGFPRTGAGKIFPCAA